MKMKKLLAGVLSAAMIATMIPASMAFSSVSAAPEAMASYDFTQGENQGWKAVYAGSGMVQALENQPVSIQSNASVSGPSNRAAYSIENPLAAYEDATGYTVVMDANILSTTGDTQWCTLFGFGNDKDIGGHTNYSEDALSGFMCVTADGGFHKNQDGWFDFANTAEDILQGQHKVVATMTAAQVVVYVDGQEVGTYTESSITDPTHAWASPVDYVKNATWFSLGASSAFWTNASMNVNAVSFYDSALTAEQVAALSGIVPEEVTLLNEYDLTTVEGRTAWTASSDEITEDENGVTFTTNGQNDFNDGTGTGVVRYFITNPYLNSNSNTMTIVTDVKTGDVNIDYFATLYGFYNNSDNNLFGLSTNGRGAHWNYTQNGMGYFDVNAGTVVD
ncbi:MAG TPA: hypothetical protein IAD19_03825, partial [Candidatus Egerieicola faecale]|nr:hypothetical protein [Candidatus Egerieicola faecale]